MSPCIKLLYVGFGEGKEEPCLSEAWPWLEKLFPLLSIEADKG